MENTDSKQKRRPTITEWTGVRPAPKAVGEVIRKFAKRYNIKILQVEMALEAANKNHVDGWTIQNYENDIGGIAPLAHNYIYRRWPDISLTATLNIVCEAFESLLSKQYKEDEIQSICKRLKEEIRALYSDQADKDGVRIVGTFGLQYFFENNDSIHALFISKNLEAASSLTKQDILFWDGISKWNSEKRKKFYRSLLSRKIGYQTIISPAFQQWVTLRGKNYSDSVRKERKGTPKPSKTFLNKIQKLSGDEAQSVRYILNRLRERVDSGEGKKYPLALPEELDILILFKYFLSDEAKGQYIEKLQKEQKKAAGDN